MLGSVLLDALLHGWAAPPAAPGLEAGVVARKQEQTGWARLIPARVLSGRNTWFLWA